MADLPQTTPKMTKYVNVVIIDYPHALQSAIQGLKELLLLANKIAADNNADVHFTIEVITHDQKDIPQTIDLVILPPNLDGTYFETPEPDLLQRIVDAHQNGAIICSACAGAFILAKTGLINNRTVTTHWQLEQRFGETFPSISLNVERLLINDGDIITAGGLMSWIDLGMEIVAQFAKPSVMRALGKFLIVDTGKREQKYYVSFSPKLDHGNKLILKVQHYIQANYSELLNVSVLAEKAFMTERTFYRQFTEATTLKPTEYVQKIRVQKACELLESSSFSFEQIALSVGYDDANSFRKVFNKIMGLSPSSFRARFS